MRNKQQEMRISNSNSDDHTKINKLRCRRGFPNWKQQIMLVANAKGFDQYLTTNIVVKTQAELDAKEIELINEINDDSRKMKKGELTKWKREEA